MFFIAELVRLLVVRAIIVHKIYCSDLVYIPEPLAEVTTESHMM